MGASFTGFLSFSMDDDYAIRRSGVVVQSDGGKVIQKRESIGFWKEI